MCYYKSAIIRLAVMLSEVEASLPLRLIYSRGRDASTSLSMTFGCDDVLIISLVSH
jgi:hypothetical protein